MSRVLKSAAIALSVGSAVLVAAGAAAADAGAQGAAIGSPGVLSGNVVQVPVHVPVNACGNTVNAIGLLNPAFGNACANGSGGWGHAWDESHMGQHGSMNHDGDMGYGEDGGMWK
ncbi:chaplin [Streptomyces sp. VRA16 Mangrove soil]|uniref:chaplin n=1 Tax=Streptomyces sp. VRA16 Mangrove soil TaxID=2817434 RepID=UPI001A9D2DC8|nr:chaplin [Streptomyces sp. VRA16 Mangrove soil]MBO1337961.1 chaplin [Streptomyces sp. VRA16 Mangrove soil]